MSISHYSLGSLLTTVAGLVSFPFLTRIFAVSDYGLMSLVSATIAALVAIGKLGLQHAVVRFYPRTRTDAVAAEAQVVVSTAVPAMTASALIIAAVWSVTAAILPTDQLADGRLRALAPLMSLLIGVQVVDSSLVSLLRADQRSGIFNTYQVVKKYLGLGVMIGSLLLVGRDLSVFYSAQACTEVVAVLGLTGILFGPRRTLRLPSIRFFSPMLFRDMLRYGVPMMLGWELAGLVLSLGDRYVVQALLGSQALGVYAAAYSLCQYVEAIMLSPWGLAATPIYLGLWRDQGPDAARAFVERTLRYYFLVAAPIVAGVSAVGSEALGVVASDNYRPGASVIPLVVAGLVAAGAVPLVGAGVFIQKSTWTIARSVVLCALLNLALNIALIPTLGIRGAGLATLGSYLALLALVGRAAMRCLSIDVPWIVLAKACAAAATMYLVVVSIVAAGSATTLLLRVLLGVLLYSGLILVLDANLRDTLRESLVKARST